MGPLLMFVRIFPGTYLPFNSNCNAKNRDSLSRGYKATWYGRISCRPSCREFPRHENIPTNPSLYEVRWPQMILARIFVNSVIKIQREFPRCWADACYAVTGYTNDGIWGKTCSDRTIAAHLLILFQAALCLFWPWACS